MTERIWFKQYDRDVPRTLCYPDWTLSEILIRTAADHPDYIATTLNGRDLTYRDINLKVNGLARALVEMGIGPGDRAALLIPNSPTYVIAFYALMKTGAIAVNINVTSIGEELTHFLNDAGAKIVFTLDLFLNNIMAVASRTKVGNIIIQSILGLEKQAIADQGRPQILYIDDLIAAQSGEEPLIDCNPDNVAVLQYTGGSTGRPKAAVLTHRNIISNIFQVSCWNTIRPAPNAAVTCILPFFHVFGMTVCLHLSVLKGYRMILFPMFDWSSVLPMLKTIRKYRPVSMPAVPALWAALIGHPLALEYGLGSIEIATAGGAPVPVWLQEQYSSLTGRSLSQAYGLSEASSTHITPFQGKKKPDAIGIPLPDTDVRIVDIETGDRDCAVREVGEMIVRGPQVMQGYWKDPERTAEALRGGWLYTRDLAWMDEDGYFYLVDRKDDLIITNGFNVYPSEIEKALLRHPAIQEAAVVGTPDRIRGEAIAAYIVFREGEEVATRTLIDHCRRELPDYKIPRQIKAVTEIPKNKIGKPLKRTLREKEKR